MGVGRGGVITVGCVPSEDLQHLRDAVVRMRLQHKLEEDVADDTAYQSPPLRQLAVDAMGDGLRGTGRRARRACEWNGVELAAAGFGAATLTLR